MFLALSGIIGRGKDVVLKQLEQYSMPANEDADCLVQELDGNTTIVYPDYFTGYDDCSAIISKALNCVVFSCHIHDGDLWMYVLYSNGQVIDQYNPMPDYWDDSISDEERDSWKGSAAVVAGVAPWLQQNDVARYLVPWNHDDDGHNQKAYPNDQYPKEDWQLLDFMRKLKLPYPPDDDRAPVDKYDLRTKQLARNVLQQAEAPKKQWWKFW